MKRIIFLIAAMTVLLQAVMAQSVKVSGKVLDNNNETIIGGTVIEKGTTNGTTTDFDGNFNLSVGSRNAVLVVSYVGMKTQEISVGTKNSGLVIVLQPDTKVLDEVVVVGFGTQKKINSTGAVKSIDAKALESRPISMETSISV